MVEASEVKFANVCNLCKKIVHPYELMGHLITAHGYREDYLIKVGPSAFYTPVPVIESWPSPPKKSKKKK